MELDSHARHEPVHGFHEHAACRDINHRHVMPRLHACGDDAVLRDGAKPA
jgi:hypothetical protein